MSRSRSSLNSKRTNSNNTKKRKKDDGQQQTLVGMAWGSNSKSSSAFRSSPFSDFGSYMEVKNRKLHEQFDAEASCSSHGGSGSEKPVFYGVSIFVDGYTVPSSQELRAYMLKHGGRFENYFSRQRVTHIICSNLPNSKVKNLRSFSRGLPVVKPTWVLDSVAAKKLLNWVPYQLDQIASEANNQPKLSTFLGLRSSLIPGDHADVAITSDVNISEVSDSAEDVKQTNQDAEYYVRDSLDFAEDVKQTNQDAEYYVRDSLDSAEDVKQTNQDAEYYVRDSLDSAEDVKQTNQESEYYVRDSLDESEVEEPTCSNNCENEASRTNDVLINEMQSECNPRQPSSSEGSRCSEIQHVTETLSVVPNSSNKGHSTSDPNFVETYFKNSRLHFIGTWKQRYRKRFPRPSDAFRPSSSISPSSTCQSNTIIHIDMDCFFVSVVIRNRPELWDKPVAVCHSDNPRGTSEISSANYPARDHGVRAGIFVRDAKALCPHLVIVPYNFEAYEEVADQFYSILHKHCNKVQAMSCDEAILDITDLEVDDPENLASLIRKEIFDTTGCTASVGISSNMLMARLATRSAKPNGQCYLPLDKVDDFMEELPVKALPGIGRALEEKLKGRHVKTCGELRKISKESLQKDFGQKTGDMLWNHCRGIDNRLVGMIQETKSVGADVNWGVRFKDVKDCQHFLLSLCKEVSLRLHGCGVSGRTFTLKIKRRKTDEEPVKYMGCGDCDNLSHSLTVPMATDDVDVLQRIAKQLFSHFHIDVEDIRGVGLHVTKLECADNVKQGSERSSIRSWLVSASVPQDKEQFSDQLHRSKSKTVGAITSNQEDNQSSGLPSSPSGFDPDYLKCLPPEIISEYNEFYGGRLINFISKHRSESIDAGTSSILPGDTRGVTAQFKPVVSNNVAAALTSQNVDDAGVMPSSLSQIDASALQEYPQEIRDEILNNLPAHRNQETIPDASPQGLNLNHLEIQARPTDHDSSNALWSGNPPHWVQIYKSSDSQILRYLSDTYSGLKSTYDLSSVLLKTVAATEMVCIGGSTTECDDASRCLCELLQQYIELKVESDLEEIHTCFRILRRLSVKSELFLHVYNTTIPHLQTTVGEKYGGSLCF